MRIALFYLSLFLVLINASCSSDHSKTITIATAANVQFAMRELANSFEEETGISTSIIIGSSGKLTAQIIEGAPFDIFVSADMKFPNKIYDSGLGVESPRIYAYGSLILISLRKDLKPSFSILHSDSVNHISIANAKTAPYGRAAEQMLNYYGEYEKLSNKLVFGESISQTNQFILSGAAELGFTARSSFIAFSSEEKSFITIDPKSYDPIEQGAILIKRPDQNIENAKKFYLFLFSEKAQAILKRNGYETPTKLKQ